MLVLAGWTLYTVAMMTKMETPHHSTIRYFCTKTDLIIVTAECQSVHDRGQRQILHGTICRVPAKHPDRLIVLDAFHHGRSNDLEYVSTEVQNFLIAPSICKLKESCSYATVS